MTTWLLDTGPVVAYLDATEEAHERVALQLDPFAGRLVTTSAVVTEAMHFLSASPGGPGLLADFVRSADVQVADFCDPESLAEAAHRMERYRNLPMDFADATLVLLAEALGSFQIATLDRRGFAAYRSRTGRAFSLVLDAEPAGG